MGSVSPSESSVCVQKIKSPQVGQLFLIGILKLSPIVLRTLQRIRTRTAGSENTSRCLRPASLLEVDGFLLTELALAEPDPAPRQNRNSPMGIRDIAPEQAEFRAIAVRNQAIPFNHYTSSKRYSVTNDCRGYEMEKSCIL